MNVDRCIICGKSSADLGDVNPLTEEHIIPKALGNNSLKCCFLCKTCNSRLGDTIDAAFINSFDIKLIRNQLGIKGRNGIPNPFANGKDSNGNVVHLDEKMHPKMVSRVEKTSNGIRIHASSKEEAKKIAQKALSRKGINQEAINEVLQSIESKEPKQYRPEISYKIELNLRNRLLAILKIAYEYACFKLGDRYYIDDRANEIRTILQNEINHNETIPISDFGVIHAPEDFSQVLNTFNDAVPLHHLLVIQNDATNRLFAIVSLFGRFEHSFFVLLSNNASNCILGMTGDLFDIIQIDVEIVPT